MPNKLKLERTIKEVYKYNKTSSLVRPLLGAHVPAGFPSPAQDYIESSLDLNEYLITHPAATYFIRVEGYSMSEAGIFPDDMLIVDRGMEAAHNKIIIAILDGELTVKRLHIIDDVYWLKPENKGFDPIRIDASIDFYIWGVATYVIHKL